MKSRLCNAIVSTFELAFKAGPINAQDISSMLEIPPDASLGDYALPCFKFSKAYRMSPNVIAQRLSDNWSANDVATVTVAGGYLNFKFERNAFTIKTLDAIRNSYGKYGASSEGYGKTVVIDFSSVNIAKRFHMGHLSTTMIGHSLKRLLQYMGYEVIGINHLGDWGTQFGNLISAFKRWGTKESIESSGIQGLQDLYVRFHNEAKVDPALLDEGRDWFLKIERHDPEALMIFEWFKNITMRDVAKVYELLGVTFDSYTGESYFMDKMQPIIDELREKGLLTLSDGASIVDLSEFDMPPVLILKRDGATLYATRDLAAAKYRADTYHFDKCLYVVAYQQDLHFRQLFKVLSLMGYPWADDMVHVSYGMVSYEGQPLATREGHTVYLEDVLNAAINKARSLIDEKSPDLADKDETARVIGVGAIVYTVLSSSRIKDIDFRWDRSLNFDGETGPYVQYTHARCTSLLEKSVDSKLSLNEEWDPAALSNDEAQAVIRLLSTFPDAVADAARRYEPSILTRHITQIAQSFNRYYYEHRILEGPLPVQRAGVLLTRAVQDVIKTGLYLLGINAPNKM